MNIIVNNELGNALRVDIAIGLLLITNNVPYTRHENNKEVVYGISEQDYANIRNEVLEVYTLL